MKLIVGLGNPGIKYQNTRHNIGFKAIDTLANHFNVTLNKEKFQGLYFKNQEFVLAKPMTYMNLSGDFVVKMMKYFKIKLADVLIIYDDMALEVGKIMLKPQGSSNGHNGLQDIINKVKSSQFARLKIGIGKTQLDHASYVLGNFTPAQLSLLLILDDKIIEVVNNFINFNVEIAMNKMHQG